MKNDVKKNNMQIKLIYFLLFVFVIMVASLVYFLVSDNALFKPNDEPKPIKPPEEPIIIPTELTKSDFENILDNVINVNFLEEGFDNIEDLSNQQKLALLFYAKNDYISNNNEITKEIVDNYLEENYGTMVLHENIKCDIDSETEEYCYLYDIDKMVYTENFNTDNQKQNILAKYMNRKVYAKTTDYIKNDNIYQLTRYELYKEVCIDDCNLVTQYYSTVKDANNKTTPLIKLSSRYSTPEIIEYNTNKMYSTIFNVNFDIYKNIMPSYTYTFEKIGDNYILTNYQINTLD